MSEPTASHSDEARRPAPGAEPQLADAAFDGWLLRRAAGELWRDGTKVRLQEQPLQILDELVAHAGELVTRERLIRRLWPKGVVDFDTSLNTAVRKLRVALQDDSERPRYVETVPRKGYRFIGRLDAAPASRAPGSAESDPPAGRSPASRTAPLRRMGFAAALVIAIAVLVFVALRASDDGRAAASGMDGPAARGTEGGTAPRLAILPFRDLSPEPGTEYFVAGLHEEVVSTLATRAPGLEVVSRATMASLASRGASVKEIAHELGATHVLDGSVRREGEQVKLALQLVDASRDQELWSRSFERTLQKAISLQTDVAADVAAQLSARLTGPDPAPITSDPEAFDLYLQARAKQPDIAPGEPAAPREHVLDLLGRAIELDPSFALARVVRARVHMDYFISNLDVGEQRLAAMRDDLAAARRLANDDRLGQDVASWAATFVDLDPEEGLRLARTVSGDAVLLQSEALILSTMGRYDESDRIFERLLTLDPANQRLLRMRGGNLAAEGRSAEYLRHMRWLQQLTKPERDPCVCLFLFDGEMNFPRPSHAALLEAAASTEEDSGPLLALFGELPLLRVEGRYAEIRELLDRVQVESVRAGWSTGTVPGLGRSPVAAMRGTNDLLLGDRESAAKNAREVLDFVATTAPTKWNGWYLRMLAAEGYLLAGDPAKAVAITREALVSPSSALSNVHAQRYREFVAAATFAWAGEPEEAVTLLEKMATTVPRIPPVILARDPLFTVPLQQDARYRALRERLEAEIAANRLL